MDGPELIARDLALLATTNPDAFRSALHDRGALSPVSALAPAPRRVTLRSLVASIIARWLGRR